VEHCQVFLEIAEAEPLFVKFVRRYSQLNFLKSVENNPLSQVLWQ